MPQAIESGDLAPIAPRAPEPSANRPAPYDQPISYRNFDFWGQFIPLAFVVTFLAAIASVNDAPSNLEPVAPAPVVETTNSAVGFSHDQFDPNSVPTVSEILKQMPPAPGE